MSFVMVMELLNNVIQVFLTVVVLVALEKVDHLTLNIH